MDPRLKKKMTVFIDFASRLSTLSTCKRLQVGCIITDLRQVYAIGYNGIPSKCDNDLCNPDVPGACGCVHAEANALTKLSSEQPDLWLHCTHQPCAMCSSLIINRGNISKVTYTHSYRDPSGLILLRKVGIDVGLFE
jgi:dCMP deaminase